MVVAPGLVAENVWLRQQLEGAWSHNDFNARSDIFTFRAPFEAVAEFRFVGMPISDPDVTPRRWSNGFQLLPRSDVTWTILGPSAS